MKRSFYILLIFFFINQVRGQISLENSIWMFEPEFATFYQDRYDFVRFNDKNEIEYLNGKGELIRKDTFTTDKTGNYKIEGYASFKAIEFIDSNKINLVFEGPYLENDQPMGIKEMKYKLTKLPKTAINISQKALEVLFAKSEWEWTESNRESKKIIKLSAWESISKEEKEKVSNDARRFSSYKKSNHLIKIANAIILIRQRLDMVTSKAIVSKITENELVVLAENREWIFKRIR